MRRRSVWAMTIGGDRAAMSLWGLEGGHKEIYDESNTPAAQAFYDMRRARHFQAAWQTACAVTGWGWLESRIVYMRARNACMGVSR